MKTSAVKIVARLPLGVAALVLSLALRAHAAPPAPPKVELDAAVKSKLLLLHDGKGHYVASVPFDNAEDRLFYGDGKSFYSVTVASYYADGDKHFSATVADPRMYRGYAPRASFDFKDGKYSVSCAEKVTVLTPVEPGQAKKLLGAAAFMKSPRKWKAYALARDNRGIYYFVDRGRSPDTDKNFRLFVGPKGNLKQQKMINVVEDSEGDIFATKTGSLRLVLGKNESSWIQEEKPTKLTLVPIEDNIGMIYNDLGVYTGERLGLPCDDL